MIFTVFGDAVGSPVGTYPNQFGIGSPIPSQAALDAVEVARDPATNDEGILLDEEKLA